LERGSFSWAEKMKETIQGHSSEEDSQKRNFLIFLIQSFFMKEIKGMLMENWSFFLTENYVVIFRGRVILKRFD